jgi:predicted RNase H-like HicB family nuclease
MVKGKKISQVLNFNAVFIEEKDGGFSVSVPALPGCFSQGDTFEEALKNVREAIELYLEEEPRLTKERASRGREFVVPVEVYGR